MAFTGIDGSSAGHLYVMDYASGATPGTGVGATVSNARQLDGLTYATSSTTAGTTWLDNDHLLVLDNSGNVHKVTVSGSTLSTTDVASVNLPQGGSVAAFTSLAYEPNLSPYVYIGLSQNSTGSGTTNRVYVLDPNNSYAQVGSFDYSTSSQTSREIAFDSKGNLFWSEFG